MSKTHAVDVIVVGKGPAGISAAVYARRAGCSVCVLASGGGALEKVATIENYFGFAQPVSGKALLDSGEKQAIRLGIELVSTQVLSIQPEPEGTFLLTTNGGEYRSIALILATGAVRAKTKIEGLQQWEGRGVSRCAVCDGFFFRGRTVGVLGAGDFAVSEAVYLSSVAGRVTLFTNGAEKLDAPAQYAVNTAKIARAEGQNRLERLVFEDGTFVALDGLFLAEGVASADDFAVQLGLQTENGVIKTARDGTTNLPGLFAAGDCTAELKQVSTAVGDGARAGLAAASHVKKQRDSVPHKA